jgi:hypothetical protein
LTLACLGVGANATVIGFEDLGNVGTSGTVITNQYAGVVFSSTNGMVNRVSSQSGIGAGLNFLCTATSTINCTGETVLDFSSAVSGVSFLAAGDDNQGVTAKVDVFVNGLLAGTEDVVTDGIFNTTQLVNLASYSNVTRVRIHSITDGGGLGWDNFSFTVGSNTVPEPQTAALVLAALAGLGVARRRRQA